MQSMPSFVYLNPVVAFIGSGKPAGVVAIMIFGSPPVIRFTVLGLQQVPSTIREATIAFGATPRYLLWKVDLPLASQTLIVGVNQTILLLLALSCCLHNWVMRVYWQGVAPDQWRECK